MTNRTRRLSASRVRRDAHRILRHTLMLVVSDPTHPDRELLQVCRAFSRVARELDSIFRGGHRLRDEAARRRRQDELDERAYPLLRRAADLTAITADGHAARAAVFAIWNAGEIFHRAATQAYVEDLLLAALIHDLVRCQSAHP